MYSEATSLLRDCNAKAGDVRDEDMVNVHTEYHKQPA